MRAYKLLRKLSDGKLYPLFIHKTYSTPFNKWMQAECYPTKGFAVRCGWHCCFKPLAPHLSMQLANKNQRNYENLNRFSRQMAITKLEVVVVILFMEMGKIKLQ